MTKKKGKTGKRKAAHKDTGSYPIYAVIQASNNKKQVDEAIKTLVHEAQEYKSILYLTIQSGNPPPPKCPPGQTCND